MATKKKAGGGKGGKGGGKKLVLGKARAPKGTTGSTKGGIKRSLLKPKALKGNTAGARKARAALRAAGGGGFLGAPAGIKGSVGSGSDS